MRKLIIILVVVAAFGAGYSAYWHKKADDFKQMFVQSADSLNAAAKPLVKNATLLRYESVTVTGFPFDMVIEVSKPVLELPVSAAITLAYPQTSQAAYEWIEEVSFADKMTLSGNITGNHFTVTFDGDRTEKALINGKPRHALLGSSGSPLSCSLGVERPAGGAPWTMQPIFTDPQTFLTIFRTADCSIKDTVLKDATTGATLLSSEGFSFSSGNVASGNANHKLTLKIDSSKTKAAPAFDAVFNDYMLMTYSLMGRADQMVSPIPFSEAGEQSIKLDMAYDGPSQQELFVDPGLQLHFDVNALSMQSALGNFDLNTHVASLPQGNDRTVSIAFHETAEGTELGYTLGEKHFAEMLKSLQHSTSQVDSTTQTLQKIAALGAPDVIAAKVYPRMYQLGKLAVDLDLNLKGPNEQATAFLEHSIVTLDDFNITVTPYGVKMKGSGNGMVAGKIPSGDLSVTCLACDALLTDVGNYAMQIEPVFDAISPTPKQPVLTKELIEGAKQFLHGIAENANAKDLVIHMVFNNTGFTVSGKQLPEVMALYMTTVAPHVPQSAPAAGGGSQAPQ